MAEHVLFFSDKCPDTKPFVEELERQGLEYEAVNITETMANLKRFLVLRDTRHEFDEVKKWQQVGVPALLMSNNQIILQLSDLNGTACTLTARPEEY